MSNNHSEQNTFNTGAWLEKLSAMTRTAETAEDRTALQAFQRALAPYLSNQESLRAVLSKIQVQMIQVDVQRKLETRSFSSVEEIRALLPSDVALRVEGESAGRSEASVG